MTLKSMVALAKDMAGQNGIKLMIRNTVQVHQDKAAMNGSKLMIKRNNHMEEVAHTIKMKWSSPTTKLRRFILEDMVNKKWL